MDESVEFSPVLQGGSYQNCDANAGKSYAASSVTDVYRPPKCLEALWNDYAGIVGVMIKAKQIVTLVHCSLFSHQTGMIYPRPRGRYKASVQTDLSRPASPKTASQMGRQLTPTCRHLGKLYHPAMNEAAASGILLTLISATVLGIGFATGAMPFNYKALDTGRETSPTTFWAFAGSWTLFGVFGIAIAVRHWSV